MEAKWVVIAFAAITMSMFAGVGTSEYMNHKCRIELAKSNRTVDEIAKICK